MDTKWKKYRNNTALKIIAFLLACTFAFLTFYSAFYVVEFQYKNANGMSDFFQGTKMGILPNRRILLFNFQAMLKSLKR